MGYLGYKPADKPLTSADITDGIIVNADIANSTINLTTKVTGTLPLTNGGTGLSTLGTASQELRVNSGATALEYYTPTVASSDFVLLASTDASSSASVSFDGYYSSTYKNYQIIISYAIPATNVTGFRIRFRRSNADITSSNYYNAVVIGSMNSTEASAGARGAWNGSYINTDGDNQTNTTAWGGSSLVINIYNPLNTASYKKISFTNSFMSNGIDTISSSLGHSVLTDATTALSGITFYFSSGNIASGNFKLYGIK